MPIYPFERMVYPIRYPSPFLVKGNKVKGPGGIVPYVPEDASEADVEKKKMMKKGSSGDTGPSKGQYVGPSTTQTAASGSVAPTPQPQHHQQVQSHQQHQQQHVTQPYRPPGPDRSVYTAAGGAALGSNIQIEKLPPETSEHSFPQLSGAFAKLRRLLMTAKHFDRDPDTNEMLWFSGPPLNIPRAPSAKHSLAYLHFLAMKRKQEEQQQDDADGTQNGDQTAGSGAMSNKRMRAEAGVRPTARETAQKLWVEMGMDV